MTSAAARSQPDPTNGYARALRAMTSRYERLVQGVSLLRELDALDDTTLSLQEICTGIVRVIATGALAENCSLMAVDARNKRLEIWAATGVLEDGAAWLGAAPQGGFRLGEGIAGQVAQQGRPVVVQDTANEPGFMNLDTRSKAVRSLMCFPLLSRDEVIGVINVSHSRPGFFGRDTQCLMDLVAGRCSGLLASHQMHSTQRDTEAYYRLVCECAGDGILVFDRSGALVMANSVAAGFVGTSPQQLSGGDASWDDAVLADDLVRVREFRRNAMQGLATVAEYRLLSTDGVMRHVEERCALSQSHGMSGPKLVCVVRDITERRLAAEKRQALEAQLFHAQKMEALGELAGGITHDFNNLLTGILGNASMAASASNLEEMRELLADIEGAAGRAATLTRQLLSISRRSQVVHKPVDIASLFAEVGNVIRYTLDRRIKVTIECEQDLPLAWGDAGQIHQMLLNLCVNARDALMARDRTDPTAPLAIRLRARREHVDAEYCRTHVGANPGHWVRVDVSDTGIGIPQEMQSRIFEPFFTSKADTGGTGLGLSIVYGIVRQHGGWIVVQSESGFGATFTVYLGTATPSAVPSAAPPAPVVHGGRETVLIADDEAPIRKYVARALRKLGYEIVLARDGVECLAAYQARPDIDVVLLDMCMPNMSGQVVMQRILALNPSAKIIVSSGHTGEEHPGSAASLPKPYAVSQMAATIRRVLDGEKRA